MISIQPDWRVIIGLAVTVLLGCGVGCLVRRVGDSLGPLPPPSPALSTQWTEIANRNMGGCWIGFLERPMFFAAFWTTLWPILPSWLAFKLAFYWQSANFTALPPSLNTPEEANYLVAKDALGKHYVATALVGTAANIVLALIGVAVGKWIRLQ